MHYKHILLIGLIFFVISQPLYAISTTQIDTVRNKEAIADADGTIIEEFLSEAFAEFTGKTQFTDIAALRNVIVSKSTSATTSGQILYGPKYLAVLQKELTNAFATARTIKEDKRRNVLLMNLLVLTYDIANIDISKAALDYLQDANVLVRYWAVNNFTNTNLLKALNEGDAATRKNIASQLLNGAKAEQSPDIQIIYAQFAAGIKDEAGIEILTTIAQKRIDLYMSWSAADDDMTDDWILKALSDKAKNEPESIKTMAKYFSMLLSAIVQKYILAEQSLSENSKIVLISLIAQGDKYLQVFVPDWTGNLKRALDKGGATALLTESEALFGSAGTAGKMAATIGFDYGKNADGSAKMFPPAPPKPNAAK